MVDLVVLSITIGVHDRARLASAARLRASAQGIPPHEWEARRLARRDPLFADLEILVGVVPHPPGGQIVETRIGTIGAEMTGDEE